MAKTWLGIARWRWIVVVLGVVLPWGAVWFVRWFVPPSPLRFESPQHGVIAVQYREAAQLMARGDLAAAQAKLEALRDQDPFNPLIHAQLGQLHRQAGRPAEALAATRAAVGVDPKLGAGWYNMACDLVKLNQPEEALRQLGKAVAAGFDVRTPAAADPDLARLREDQRLQVYLEGAASIPLQQRSAALVIAPEDLRVGQQFALTLEVLALNQPAGGVPPEVSIAFRGPSESEVVLPVRVSSSFAQSAHAGTLRYRWSFRYDLVGRVPFAGRIGPWEVQLGGVAVPIESPLVVIDEDRVEAARPSFAVENAPPFRPQLFFAYPRSPPAPASGRVRAEVVQDGGAWASGAVALIVSPLPAGGPESIDARFDSGLAPLASYDEIFPTGGLEGPPTLRRVYAYAPEVLSVVARAPVTVKLGPETVRVPIAVPASGPAPRAAP